MVWVAHWIGTTTKVDEGENGRVGSIDAKSERGYREGCEGKTCLYNDSIVIRRPPRVCAGSGQYCYRPDPRRRVSSIRIEAIVGALRWERKEKVASVSRRNERVGKKKGQKSEAADDEELWLGTPA